MRDRIFHTETFCVGEMTGISQGQVLQYAGDLYRQGVSVFFWNLCLFPKASEGLHGMGDRWISDEQELIRQLREKAQEGRVVTLDYAGCAIELLELNRASVSSILRILCSSGLFQRAVIAVELSAGGAVREILRQTDILVCYQKIDAVPDRNRLEELIDAVSYTDGCRLADRIQSMEDRKNTLSEYVKDPPAAPPGNTPPTPPRNIPPMPPGSVPPMPPDRMPPVSPIPVPDFAGQTVNYVPKAGETSVLTLPPQTAAEEKRTYVLFYKKLGKEIQLTDQGLTIGKGIDNDYIIFDNTTVSRRHARLFCRNGSFFLADNHSTNGTFVNEQKMDGGAETMLKDGDRIRFSDEEFEFRSR